MERRQSDRSNAYVVYEHGVGSGSSGSHSHSHRSHHGSHHRSHHGDSRGANNPLAEPVTSAQPPAQPTIPETIPEEPPAEPQPAPMNDQASFTDQSGYQTVVQPVSGGRAVRVSVGTGYTANGVAPQAGNYYPPSQNPFANYNNPAGSSQATAQDQANYYHTNQAAAQDQANYYYTNQAAGQDPVDGDETYQAADPETMAQAPEGQNYPEGNSGNVNGLGFGWSQPDPSGRQYLHYEKKHHKKHHHHHHHRH